MIIYPDTEWKVTGIRYLDLRELERAGISTVAEFAAKTDREIKTLGISKAAAGRIKKYVAANMFK